MIKIKFWLKKSDNELDNLDYITIDNPQKVADDKLVNMYSCKVYLSDKNLTFPIYANNPIDALCNASESAKTYLQGLIKRGFYINEIESKEPWKLEKLGDDFLQKKLNEISDSKDLSQKDKQIILSILKESFGGESSPIKDEVNKLI